MNPKIKKAKDELERTKAKIAELQALVPQLERGITEMENNEIIRLVRSSDISLADLPAFLASIKNSGTAAPAETNTALHDSRDAGGDYTDDPLNEEGYDDE